MDLFFIAVQVDCTDYYSGKKTISETPRDQTSWGLNVLSKEFIWTGFAFSDTANGCKQAEYHIASDISPRSGCSTGTVTSASSYQQTHCKYLKTGYNKIYLVI